MKKRKTYREPTMTGRKPGFKSMVWSRRKKETFNQNRMKKQEFKKVRRGFRNLQNNFKCSNIRIIGIPEGEEEEQGIQNLFEQIMKENFPNLAKELSGSPGSSESPKEAGPKVEHTKAHHHYITQD